MTLSVFYITNDPNVFFLRSYQKQKPYGIISRRKKTISGIKKTKSGREKTKKKKITSRRKNTKSRLMT